MNKVTQERLQRLSVIHYLYQQGESISKLPEPQAGVSVLSFHDAIEMFLHLCCEVYGFKAPERFLEYWSVLEKAFEVPLKEQMSRLNRARVSLKHHGSFPSMLSLKEFQLFSKELLIESTKKVFEIEFESISFHVLVESKVAQKYIESALQELEQKKYGTALCAAAIAFREVINNYYLKNTNKYDENLLSFGPSLNSHLIFNDDKNPDFGESFAKLTAVVESLQHAQQISVFGIDYRQYIRFRELTPYVQQTANGEYSTYNSRPDRQLSGQIVKECIDFVIQSTLKIQNFNLEIPERMP